MTNNKSLELEDLKNNFVPLFENWLNQELFAKFENNKDAAAVLFESQKYSLQTGGKRFRPFLSFLVTQLYEKPADVVRCYALALEMIHTYSLIHDDLPCMDNDDFRRGKPTNHKVFSEDIALLAGDGLLTDAFGLIASDTLSSAEDKIKVIQFLSHATGSFGMVGGQTLDMKAHQKITLDELILIHTLKTANLIQAAVVGAGYLVKASDADLNQLSKFGHALGMAFQIKDDLLDHQDENQDFKSYVGLLGLEKTKQELDKYSQLSSEALQQLSRPAGAFQQLVEFNLKRSH